MQMTPKEGPITDLIWSDPNDQNPEVNYCDSPRGAGHLFGLNPTKEFLSKNNLSLIIRTHQFQHEGYKYHLDNQVLTVYSAPNYCYSCANRGGIAKINKELKVSIITYEATDANL